MKRSFIIIFAILSSICTIGQTFVNDFVDQNKNYVALKMYKGDTLRYVQHNFINNKQKYVGKDLNTLLKDIEIPIITYEPGTSMENTNYVPYIYLQFCTTDESNRRMFSSNHPVNIIISWPKAFSKAIIDSLWVKTKGDWTIDARKFFGKYLIRDIETTEWK